MFRRYDWECQQCSAVFERIVQFPQAQPAPKTLGEVEAEELTCPSCNGDASTAQRLISMPAEYHGERVLNPIVRGGKFDTVGARTVPRHGLGSLPDHCTYAEAREFTQRPEYQEWRKEKKAVQAENATKRKRMAALAAGAPVNFRRDRCPGDPKISA